MSGLNKVLETLSSGVGPLSPEGLTIEEPDVKIAQEIVRAVFSEETPDLIGKGTGLRLIFFNLIHPDPEIRSKIIKVLEAIPVPSKEEFDILEFKSKMASLDGQIILWSMSELNGPNGASALKVWCILIKFLRTDIHVPNGVFDINPMLKIVEKALKTSDVTKAAAFKCWKALIDNYSLNPKILAAHNRVKLLTHLLSTPGNAKTEELISIKCNVWWHLILKLDVNLSKHLDTVLIPLLKFMFGKNPTGKAATSLSPLKKYTKLHSRALDVLYRLLQDPADSSSVACDIPALETPLSSEVIKELILKDSSVFFNCFQEGGSYLQFGKHQSIEKYRKCFDSVVKALETLNEEALRSVIYQFTRMINGLVHELKRKQFASDLIFHTLDRLLSLFPSGSFFHLNRGVVGELILDVFHNPDVLKLAKESVVVFCDLLKKSLLLENKLPFFKKVINGFKGSCKDNSEFLCKIWTSIASALKANLEEFKEINENSTDEEAYEFGAVISVISFPLKQNIGSKDESLNKLQQDLYSLIVNSAQMVIGYKNLELESGFSSMAMDIFESTANKEERFDEISSFVFVICQHLSFSTGSNFEKIVPLLNLIVKLLRFGLERSDGLSLISRCIAKLFSSIKPNLIRPTLSHISTCLGEMISSKETEKPSQEIVKTICDLLQNEYEGSFDLNFYKEIEPFLLSMFKSKVSSVKSTAVSLWVSKFSSNVAGESLPEELTKILIAEIETPTKKTPPKSPFAALKNTKKVISKSLEDEDSQDFVVISTPPSSKKRILTDHQKDVLTSRKDDIPALYSEVSMDESQVTLPSEFASEDSQSLLLEDDSKIIRKSSRKIVKPDKSIRDSTSKKQTEEEEDVVPSSQGPRTRKRKRESIQPLVPAKRSKPALGKENKNNINKTNMFGETPLHTAVKKGDIYKAKSLLENGADVNARCNAGWMPIHDVLGKGEKAIPILELLIEHGAEIDAKGGEEEFTPLHEAAVSGNQELVSFLISKGASPVVPNKAGEKAVDVASSEILPLLTGSSKPIESSIEEKEDISSIPESMDILEEGISYLDKSIEEPPEEEIMAKPLETAVEIVAKEETVVKISEEIISPSEKPTSEPIKPCGLPKPQIDESVNSISNKVQPNSPGAMKRKISTPTRLKDPGSLFKSRGAKLLEMAKANRKSLDISSSRECPSTPKSENKMPWQRCVPSPLASPSAGILKRRHSLATESVIGVVDKPRKVQFSDPPVSEKVEIPRKEDELQHSFKHLNTEEESMELLEPEPILDDTIVFSPLVSSTDSVSLILPGLTNKTWQKTAEKELKDKGIFTIGQIANLTKIEASGLKGLKPPNVATLREALKKFHKNSVKKIPSKCTSTGVIKTLAPFVETQTQEEQEKNIQEIYERPSPSPPFQEEEVKSKENVSTQSEASIITTESQTIKIEANEVAIQTSASTIQDKTNEFVRDVIPHMEPSMAWTVVNALLSKLQSNVL